MNEIAIVSEEVAQALTRQFVGENSKWPLTSFYGIEVHVSSYYPFETEDGTKVLGMIGTKGHWTTLVDSTNRRVPFTTA